MSAALDAELYVCPAETPGRCHHRFRHTHACDYDDGHQGAHECACGHRWSDDDA